MEKTKALAKALVLERFNACIANGGDQATVEATVDLIAELIVGDSKLELLKYAKEKQRELQAQKDAIPLQVIQQEKLLDQGIAVAVAANSELTKDSAVK